MTDTSIRKQVFKLLAGYTVLLFVTLCAVALMFAFIVEDELIERLMIQQGNNLTDQYELTGVYPTPALAGFKIYKSIDQMPDIVQASYRPTPGVSEVFSPDEHHYHVLTLSAEAVLVADVAGLRVVSNPSAGWLIVLAICLSVLLLSAIFLSNWITRVTTRPVILLSQEIQGFPDPVTRFSASKREDEIGYLANCIETAVLDLNESLKRETDFTRDVSHELRTPLTILKNDVMTSTPGITRDRQLAAVDQMDLTINSLLAMARSESVEAEKFSLTALIEEAMLNNS
jgi:signal transduction histidine kinase